MPKTGKDFHQLVEYIERAIAGNSNITIESPKYLTDKITGEPREHDIVLTIKQNHHTILVAIECRDRSRKVGVGQVGEFYQKCRDTGIDKGIIVSAKGFYKTALQHAAHHNIDCFTLEQALRLDWCLAAGISLYKRNITNVHVKVIKYQGIEGEWRLFRKTETGIEEINSENVVSFGIVALNELPFDYGVQSKGNVQINITNLEDFYLMDVAQEKHSLDQLHLYISYEVEENFIPFKAFKYQNNATDEEISSGVVADLNLGRLQHKLMLLREPGGSTSLRLITPLIS